MEPLIPSLRRARLDTGLPASVSLLAAMRAWPMPDGIAVTALASWSCCRAVLVPAEGPVPAHGAWGVAWSWAAPIWSSADQAGARDTAGPPVPLSGASAAASASARSRRWYIPESGIHHHSKLTRQGPPGSAFRRRIAAPPPGPHDQSELLTCGNDDRGQPESSCRPGPDGGIRTAALHHLAGW